MTHLVGEIAPAPAIGAGVLAALGLVAFLGYAVATGTLKVYAHSLGYVIRWLAQNIDIGIPKPWGGHFHPLRPIAHGLDALDETIRNEIAGLALASEHVMSWAFARAGEIWRWMADEIAALADDVVQAVHHTTAVAIPNAILNAEHTLTNRLRGIDQTVGRIERLAEAQLARLRLGIDRLGYRVEHVIGHEIATVRSRVIGLEHGIGVTDRRVKALERRFGVAAFTGLVSIALARLVGGWIRCGNVRTLGRRICGMDPSALENLLLGSALVLSTVSVVELADELEQSADVIFAGLHDIVREFPDSGALELSGTTWPH